MANKETTYKPEPKYLFGGKLKERREGRREARKDFREEKKKQRQEARVAKKEARVSKRADIKEMRKGKRDQIAEIKGSDMTRSEKRLAIKEVRQGFRGDKKARKQRKRSEIKGIKAARKLDKQYAKEDKLRAIAENTGKFSIRGKIAGARADRIDRRASEGKGRYGRWQDKAPETYYDDKHRAEDQDDSYVQRYGGYGEMVTDEREQWRDDQAASAEEGGSQEGLPSTEVTNEQEGGDESVDNLTGSPIGDVHAQGYEGPATEEGAYKDGGFTIKYNEGGLTVKLLKGLKEKTKSQKNKDLIQARIDKKEAKKVAKEHSELGIGKGSLRQQIKGQHKEEVEDIKKKHEDREMIENIKKKDTQAGPPKGNKGMTIPNYLRGGRLYEDGGYTPQSEMSEEELSKKAYGESGKPQTQQNKEDVANKAGKAAGNIGLSMAKKVAAEHNVNWADFGKNAANAIKGGITGAAFLKMLNKWKKQKDFKEDGGSMEHLNIQGRRKGSSKAKHGMKVDDIPEEGHGVLILLGKKSDKKNK
tara:strand:- start:46124 stop:47716 length:1593 start_codon:yes stop_codon:yes gene_type:complete